MGKLQSQQFCTAVVTRTNKTTYTASKSLVICQIRVYCIVKVNVFAVLVDRHKKVYRKVNIGRLESGPIHQYILRELAGKFKLLKC
jgi:hypothetical protein